MGHFLDEFVDFDGGGDESSFSGVGEHLAGEVGGAAGGRFDVFEVVPGGGDRGKVVEGEVGMTENGGKYVIEVMGDAAGEDAEALELLGLLDLALEVEALFFVPFPFGDVGGDLHADMAMSWQSYHSSLSVS